MLTKAPVVQIHLSRFCNLRCLHCYSSSGPSIRDELPIDDLLRSTAALFSVGYRRVSLSGGEPVLAPGFHMLSRGLAAQGFQVAVITNGTRPKPVLQAMSEGSVHHCSVSFDGPPALHDEIRRRRGAFDTALATLSAVAATGQSCGAVLSVTRRSLPGLPDLVDQVCAAGAAHIQLHPLAATGRAQGNSHLIGPELSSEALLRLIAMSRLFQRLYPDLHFQADAVLGTDAQQMQHCETELVSPLVITDDGALLPFCFDISRAFALSRLGDALPDLTLGRRLKTLLDAVTTEVSAMPAASFYRELVAAADRAKLPTAT